MQHPDRFGTNETQPVVEQSTKKHNHYYKDCPFDQVDVYRVLRLFNVNDPCLSHALKKLLVAGGRGAGKDIAQDIQEAIDSLTRWQEMNFEDNLFKNNIPVDYTSKPL